MCKNFRSLLDMSVLSLSKQSGLVALESLHQSCLQLESNYMKSWLPTLSNKNLLEEEQLDCLNLNLESIVTDYESKQRKRKRRVVKRVEGIPVGSSAKDYITYRKCHYLYTINKWRQSLMTLITPQMMNDLMELSITLYRHSKDRLETGGLTLQSLLTCEWTHRYLTLTTGYRNSYRPHGLETRDWSTMAHDTRLGPSMIISSLKQASRLVHLSLERLATDEMMSTIATSARQITFLNINNSKVTDDGLLALCGLELSDATSVRTRPRISRGCKVEATPPDTPTTSRGKNVLPRWTKKDNCGCDLISHLEALSLNLTWSKSNQCYKDVTSVPMDVGFVGILDTLPLKILNSEVSGRCVLSWVKWKKKIKQNDKRLPLEVLVESRPTSSMLTVIKDICPNLTEVRCDWAGFPIGNLTSREDWIVSLPSLPNLHNLVTSDIDHKTEHLSSLLPIIGVKLTKLHLQEMWSLNTSLLRAIKENCVNLSRLVLFMSVKDILGSMTQVHVEQDVTLSCQETISSGGMKKLVEVHLMGPFRSSLTRYLLDSSPKIETLTLSVDFPDPAFCNVVPDPRKDYLGMEYMKEVMKGNSLTEVKEIHLMTQYSRGKKNLDKDFALFVLKTFPKLEHIGHFKLWSLNPKQKREIKAHLLSTKRSITVDTDQKPRPSDNVGDLRNIYVEDRMEASCLWLPIKPISTFSFFEEVAEMLVGPDILWPAGLGGEVVDVENANDNDSDSDSSDEDLDVGFVDEDGEQFPPVGLEPVCVIQ